MFWMLLQRKGLIYFYFFFGQSLQRLAVLYFLQHFFFFPPRIRQGGFGEKTPFAKLSICDCEFEYVTLLCYDRR